MGPRATVGKCPVCDAALRITELSCPSCKTRIVSDLDTCRFCNLSPDLMAFLQAFLRARGNIKEVERGLGISYPTVRKRLDQLLSSLRLEGSPSPSHDSRLEVFERLRRGEITVDEALESLGS
jgi:hypothetical protein